MKIEWIYVLLLATLVIAGVLCSIDKLSQQNFMTIALSILSAVLGGTMAYYYALSKVKDNEEKS